MLELTCDRITDTAEGKFGELDEVRVSRHVVDVQVRGVDPPGEAGPVLQAVAQSDAHPGGASWDRQWRVDLNRDLLFHGAVNTSSPHYPHIFRPTNSD